MTLEYEDAPYEFFLFSDQVKKLHITFIPGNMLQN